MALLVPKSAFGRLVDYTTENERLAAAAEEEAARLAALKKATYEMSKSWNNTIAVRLYYIDNAIEKKNCIIRKKKIDCSLEYL